MRVLHVIGSVADRYGGPTAALRGMTEALAARGAEVTVATTDADGPERLDVPLDRAVTKDGVSYRFFPRTIPTEYKLSLPLARWMATNVGAFDVVHVHSLFLFTTIPGCRLARRAGVPYVLRPLGTLGAWSLAHRGWKKAPYLALVERNHLAGAAAIHATSDAEAEALAALGYARTTRIIPLGVEVSDDALVAARLARAAARRREEPGAPYRLLFLSRLHPVKGVPVLLDAVARTGRDGAAPVALTIAGDGPPEYVRSLREQAASLELGDRVRFVGHLQGSAKIRAFDEADAFVLPSSHENFGIAAAEALAHGVPVVLTDGVGIAAEVASAGAGLVTLQDGQSLARAISELAGLSAEDTAEMAHAAVGLARRAYSWPRVGAELESLYEEIRAAAPARA